MLSLSGFIIVLFARLVSGGPCDNIVNVTSSWPGGHTTALLIPIKTPITNWTMIISFSSALTSLQVWSAASTSTNNIQFQLTNLSYNGVYSAGAILSGVGFNAYFNSSANPVPTVSSILFNGVNICSTVVSSSTTSKPVTTTTARLLSTATTAKPMATTTSSTGLPTKYNYREVITKSLLFYYAQRSGRLPVNDNPIAYRSDSALKDVGQNAEDLTGGYYDAGDHLKLGFPLASAMTIAAWSIIDYPIGYSSAGQLTTAQNMVKWASDYLIKAHVQTNKFYGQVGDGTLDHNYWGRPEDMTMSRPAYFISTTNPGSDLAGETAAALAATSMVFASVNSTYSALCLTHAKQLYDFAKQYQAKYSQSMPQAAAFYPSSDFGDELAWSAAWLYRATNNVTYLNDAKAFYTQFGLSNNPSEFSWDSKTAGVQVLMAKLTNDTLYKTATKTFCDSKVNQPKTPKGLLFISTWGSLRHAANIAFVCLQAADLNINPLAYRKLAQQQIHYALGDTGRSFVVGFGVNPPVKPHHESSSCPNRPAVCDWSTYSSTTPNPQTLYGALVGGPDSNDIYTDDRSNYVTNEVACDYNAGFQGSVAALQSLAVQGVFN
ncbi:endoglucanase-1,4-beta-glucanase [Daphnia pulex]|uniref:Endoglucanase n=1 Tax=Daphnia pulex TaxID=6669 RepID=E9GIT0_DAPPU|nr:endoglucanase-1,4-beta-glucanase [Daphnia pulex]|eukprot:EFX80604.1 endoglucanase-1,4-beta-glucanase [Daphnia pulex]